MEIINVLASPDDPDKAAFSNEKMAEQGVDGDTLMRVVAERLGGIASLLHEGRGLVVFANENGAVICGVMGEAPKNPKANRMI